MALIVEAVRRDRMKELQAIGYRYDRLIPIYANLWSAKRSTQVGRWCEARLQEGVPEWFVGAALMNFHLNAIGRRQGTDWWRQTTSAQDALRSVQRAKDSGLLREDSFWGGTDDELNLMADTAALTILQRYDAHTRSGRGYRTGSFLSLMKSLGFLSLDVPHNRLFPD